MKQLILTDVDGVLLDWFYSFDEWMGKNGYSRQPREEGDETLYIQYGFNTRADIEGLIEEFNKSGAFGYMSSHKDSVQYIRKLAAEGYIFHAISSCGDDLYSYLSRVDNLNSVFGKDIFRIVTCLPLHDDKSSALKHYKNSGMLFVDDKISNYEVADALGLEPLLMTDATVSERYNKVSTWREIYEAYSWS